MLFASFWIETILTKSSARRFEFVVVEQLLESEIKNEALDSDVEASAFP